MPPYGQSLFVPYTAWENGVGGKAGDSGNHTLKWIKDGTAATPTNAPSEPDATNCPGSYGVLITADEAKCKTGMLAGKSSTANVAIIPTTIGFEQLTILPASAIVPTGKVQSHRLTAYVGCALSFVWTLTDDDGNAVDLSGKDLAFVVVNKRTKVHLWEYTTGAGLTVSGADNNIVTLAADDTNTGTAGAFGWLLKNTTDDLMLLQGVLDIDDIGEET